MSLALIMALCFLAFVLQDLNDLWAESQELWEMFDDYWTIIEKQEDKIRNLMNDTKKAEQIQMLLDLGYSKLEIKKMKKEENRAEAIVNGKD